MLPEADWSWTPTLAPAWSKGMNNHSPAPKRAKASLSVFSRSNNCAVPVEPSVVPVCLTNRYTTAVPAATIIWLPPVVVTVSKDKLWAGAVTV